MTYETRVIGDAFAGLSTAESDAFLTEYNAARNDRERAAVIRRHLTARGSVRSQRPAKSPDNAARMDMLLEKYHPKVDRELSVDDLVSIGRHRDLMKRRWAP